MSQNVLIIEDRPSRQKRFLSHEQINRLRSIDGVNMPSESECQLIITDLSNNDFLVLCEYDLLILHRSAFAPNIMLDIKLFCKENNIALVSFSGGIGSLSCNTEMKVLSTNASSIYTEKLIWFLSNYTKGNELPLTALVLGRRWKLDQLLQARMLKTKFELEDNDRVQFMLEEEYESIINNLGVLDKDLDSTIKKMIYFT